MRGKACKENWRFYKKQNLGFPALILSCSFFFIAGLFASNLLLSQDTSSDERWLKARARQLQSVEEEMISKHNLLPSGETGDDFITLIPFQILSWRPRALYYPGFITAEQCQHIINMARPSLQPSTLALRKGETAETTKGIRTSSGMFVLSSEDQTGILQVIEEKIARATMIPRTHGEAFNVLRYEIGQKYDAHYDAFNPEEYGPQTSQRVATFLLYLSDFEEGGETTFPLENDENFEGYDAQKCNGLRVKPQQGDAILFYSVFPNNTIDPVTVPFRHSHHLFHPVHKWGGRDSVPGIGLLRVVCTLALIRDEPCASISIHKIHSKLNWREIVQHYATDYVFLMVFSFKAKRFQSEINSKIIYFAEEPRTSTKI